MACFEGVYFVLLGGNIEYSIESEISAMMVSFQFLNLFGVF